MPLYEYECRECGGTEEYVLPVWDRDHLRISVCCLATMHRVVSAIAPPIFKGSGFHCNDYGRKEGTK